MSLFSGRASLLFGKYLSIVESQILIGAFCPSDIQLCTISISDQTFCARLSFHVFCLAHNVRVRLI